VTGVEVAARDSGERTVDRGREVILAAGALATPQLLLASDLARLNPGGRVIGRYLQRHYNEILFGIFPTPPNPGGGFHKQIGIHDLYFGHPSVGAPPGKLGGMQQLPTPPVGLVRAELPRPVGAMCAPWIKHLTGLLVMAEDQPVYENAVLLDETTTDRWGVPRLLISHRHTSRDKAAGAALVGVAKRILRRAGALAFYRHHVATFSHGVGTVRMGKDRFTSALDADCRFRGLDNLTVVDASVMPTSAAVNPSLTISAIALRAAERMVARGSRAAAPTMHAAVSG
jgi:choline dehydrogenase-like flavoprotein